MGFGFGFGFGGRKNDGLVFKFWGVEVGVVRGFTLDGEFGGRGFRGVGLAGIHG